MVEKETEKKCPKCGWDTIECEEDNKVKIKYCWAFGCGYFKIELKKGEIIDLLEIEEKIRQFFKKQIKRNDVE